MSYNTKNYTEQGGEKTVIGGELEILPGAKIKAGTSGPVRIDNDGVVYLTTAGCQAESEATEVAELVSDFNTLLAKLKTAGLMDTV